MTPFTGKAFVAVGLLDTSFVPHPLLIAVNLVVTVIEAPALSRPRFVHVRVPEARLVEFAGGV